MRSALAVAVALLVVSFAALAAPPSEPVLLIGKPDSSASWDELVEPAGGHVAMQLPESRAAVVDLPIGLWPALQRDPRLSLVTRDLVSAATISTLDDPAQRAAEAWNGWRATLGATMTAEPLPGESTAGESFGDDALKAAPWWEQARTRSMMAAEELLRANGAGWENTSEFLAGKVSINLLLPESDGSHEPSRENWTSAQENAILSKTLSALSTLKTLHSGADLSFTVHMIAGRVDPQMRTGYEPIARGADPYGTTGEELWSLEVLSKLGYLDGSRMIRSRQLADATRRADGTDWAINLFVINSHKDTDGKFTDGRFAYTWIGGPHGVLTSDNGAWGAANFDKVVLHEIHHAFYALDQYVASGCACDSLSGYMAATNDNCENGCASERCVMRDNSAVVSSATRRMVGSIDANSDGTADILQVSPETTVALAPGAASCGTLVSLAGTANVVAYPNHNPLGITPARAISLSTIREVQVRVDGGAWQSGLVYADDGAFDEPQETFSLTLSLSLDRHAVEVRAIDSRGNTAHGSSWTVDATEVADAVTDSLELDHGPLGTMLSWASATGAGAYRVRRATTPNRVSTSPAAIDVASSYWNDTTPGTQFYLVTSLDGCGRESP